MSQDYTTPPPPAAKKRSMKVVALAAICIILAASLVGVGALYLTKPTNNADLQAQIAEKENLIASLNETITELQSQIASAPTVTTYLATISSLTSQLSQANAAFNELNSIAHLNMTERKVDGTWLDQQAPNSTDMVYNDYLDFAGFVVVTVQSNSTTTYASITYRYLGTDFNFNKTIGKSGTAMFVVLPTFVSISVGNQESTAYNNATVAIDYYY